MDYDNLRTGSNRKTTSVITPFFDYYLSYPERGVTFKNTLVSELTVSANETNFCDVLAKYDY